MEQSVRLPTDGAVTGWAACRLHRAAFFDGLDRDGVTRLPVPLALGTKSRIRGDSAVRLSREKLAEDEVVDLRGLRYTTICRALFDAMRWAPDVREACVAMDMAAAAELASVSMMRGYVDSHSGWEGIEQVRDALELADENSKSPNETRLRLIWITTPVCRRCSSTPRSSTHVEDCWESPTCSTLWPAWSASSTEPPTAPRGDTAATWCARISFVVPAWSTSRSSGSTCGIPRLSSHPTAGTSALRTS